MFLPHFDVFCDLLLNRRRVTWNLFVKWRVCNQPIEAFVIVSRVTRILQFQNKKSSIFVSYVIKEFAHAFRCAYIELWMQLGSLESTQAARVALGSASSNSFASFALSKLSACIHKHEQILNFRVPWGWVIPGGRYFRTFWVWMCRCDPGTLSLNQS